MPAWYKEKPNGTYRLSKPSPYRGNGHCPFCGEAAVKVDLISSPLHGFRANCPDCHGQGPICETTDDALWSWWGLSLG